MRIERIELDGFGRFADVHWELNEGMTVLLGANEAGKTTLLNAIRALLFGFEATRDGRTWYPALAGGRRGGRLVLRTQDGARWTVERHGDRGGGGALVVEAPNGNRGGQDELNRLLGGADRDLFNNIFAFGLGELEAFSSLSGDGVRSRIYGAGSGLGGTSVLDVERRLRADQESSYKPRGQEQALARMLSGIEELRTRIAELERQPEAYEAARVELNQLRARRVELRTRRSRAVEQREHLRRLLDAQPPAARLVTLQRELDDADPRIDRLPADAEQILHRVLAVEREARAALDTLDASLADAQRRRSAIAFDAAILEETAEIEALRDERVTHEARAADRQAALAAAERLDGELRDELRRVGGWTEERLLGLDDSIATMETIREFDGRLASAAATAERVGQRRESAARDVAAARVELPDAEMAEPEIAKRRAAIGGLEDLRLEAATLDERERLARRRGAAARWFVPVAATAFVVSLATLLGDYLGVQPAGTVAGVVLALAAGAWFLLRRVPVAHDSDRATLAARRSALLMRAGLPADADDAAVRSAADEMAAAAAAVRSSAAQRARLVEREVALARLEQEAAAADAARDAAVAAWDGWLADRGLPSELSPDAARQIVGAVAVARRLARERNEQLQRAAAIAEGAAGYEARLDALLDRLARVAPTDVGLRPSTVVALAREAQHAAAEQRLADDLDGSIAQLSGRRNSLADTLRTATASLAAHLERCGVADADELRRLAASAAARSQLRHEIREASATLIALAGSEAALPAFLAEASASDPAALEAQRNEVDVAASRLEADESEALTREGELRGEIARLESAEELGEARQQLALLEARAGEEARRWTVRALALTLLGETRSRYERERQPQVVRDAERYFASITNGRYPRIVAPPGEANVRVEPQTGAARTTEELSRGTAEQLYLALRFGLIEQFGRSAEPLPVVMDDIVVNFDRARAARAAHAIRDLARRHQVVFFTCHPQTAELLDPDGVATVHLD